MGRMLRALTTAATTPDHITEQHRIPDLWPMPTAEARDLLPAVMHAVLYATAGTDRAERIIDEPSPEEPWQPLCVRCDVDVAWSTANPNPNPWCEEHGHSQFGQKDQPPAAWDRAQRRYHDHQEALAKVTRFPRNRGWVSKGGDSK